MHAQVLRIHWHDKQPVFSVAFDPNDERRIATAGGDNSVRIWRLTRHRSDKPERSAGDVERGPDGAASADGGGGDTLYPEYCATLSRHIRPVNCVAFSPDGLYLGSAGDGGSLILWSRSEQPARRVVRIFGEDLSQSSDDDDCDMRDGPHDGASSSASRPSISGGDGGGPLVKAFKEHWSVVAVFRVSDMEDIYDFAWSPDGEHIVLGLTDNTCQVWHVATRKCVRSIRDHHHFVQGVAWDPFGIYLVSQSCDRSVRLWQAATKPSGALTISPLNKICRTAAPAAEGGGEAAEGGGSAAAVASAMQASYFFHDESLVSFFRRPAFSPDGALLFLPSGIAREAPSEGGAMRNCIHIMMRADFASGLPVASIAPFDTAVLGIRCNQRLFSLAPSSEASDGGRPAAGRQSLFNLPYRIVYAAFTVDSVVILDTRQVHPIAVVKDLHYGTICDAAWSPSGMDLIVSSTDGFCSLLRFTANDLGAMLSDEEQASVQRGLEGRLLPLARSASADEAASRPLPPSIGDSDAASEDDRDRPLDAGKGAVAAEGAVEGGENAAGGHNLLPASAPTGRQEGSGAPSKSGGATIPTKRRIALIPVATSGERLASSP